MASLRSLLRFSPSVRKSAGRGSFLSLQAKGKPAATRSSTAPPSGRAHGHRDRTGRLETQEAGPGSQPPVLPYLDLLHIPLPLINKRQKTLAAPSHAAMVSSQCVEYLPR